MFRTVAHIGIAVRSLNESKRLFAQLFGIGPEHEESVADQRVNTAMFRMGQTGIELLEGTAPESAVTKFVEKRGEGIHHISFSVDDIVLELGRLKNAGFQLIDEQPRQGADNCLVAFLHPKSTNGVLIELSQKR